MALVLFGLVHGSRVECGVFTFPHCCVCCEDVVDPSGKEQQMYVLSIIMTAWMIEDAN